MIDFFDERRISLTFDDVLAQTGFADFYPADISVAGRLSRNVLLPLPIVGAAMSTVVGTPMAIALAKQGGIGSIPRSLAPEEQAKQVARVKHHIHGFIDDPIFAYVDESVEGLLARRKAHGWEFDSFPVLNREGGAFVGLMTHSNFKRCDDLSAKVGAVMTSRDALVVASSAVTKREAYDMLKHHDKNVLPVMDGSAFLGMYVFSDLKRILVEKTTHNVDAQNRLRVAAAIGVGDEAVLRAKLLVAKDVDVLHIDMANGAQRIVVETIKRVRDACGSCPDIIAGNVSSADGAYALAEAKPDGILVGQGGGSICTTRVVAGIGQPQVTAVWECARALEGSGIPVISDGGIRHSGDMVIALCAGASSVMVGNLLAGTDESPGERKFKNNRYVKEYYGMGSSRAMKESAGSRQRYLHSQGAYVPEGIEGEVPYKGSVAEVLEQAAGGIRKGFHYVGARDLTELHAKAWFKQVSVAGARESHPHDITITAESPNYQLRGV